MHVFDLAMWLFFCYSFLGWLAETALAAVRTRKYVDRSLLFGPVCVVYGAAGLLISASLGELSGSWFFLFLGSAIYATVVEWLAGHMLEKLTHTRWWDYSGHRWNLDGYISLRSSALWGLLGLALVRGGGIPSWRACTSCCPRWRGGSSSGCCWRSWRWTFWPPA